jgi:hypothetical protein
MTAPCYPSYLIAKITSGTSWTAPANLVSIVAMHAIGGGQAGYDGEPPPSTTVPGADGGRGADWAMLDAPSLVDFPAGSTFDIQIGVGGPRGGVAGTDTWIKDKDGVIKLLARGGASATAANIGDDENPGGRGDVNRADWPMPADLAAVQFNGTSHWIVGQGGTGGGGAGGPDGPGADAGNLNGMFIGTISFGDGDKEYWGTGTGGGAANGGSDGVSNEDYLGSTMRKHVGIDTGFTSYCNSEGRILAYTRSIGISTTGFEYNRMPGDGGDGPTFAQAPDVVLKRAPGAWGAGLPQGDGSETDPYLYWNNSSSLLMDSWAITSLNQRGQTTAYQGYCSGGCGGYPTIVTAQYGMRDAGYRWKSYYGTTVDYTRISGGALLGSNGQSGGPGNLVSWGGLFNSRTSSDTRGPGGGGGGGPGGFASNAAFGRGGWGGYYGGGGGGGGNLSNAGSSVDPDPAGGQGGPGILLIFYITGEIVWKWGESYFVGPHKKLLRGL